MSTDKIYIVNLSSLIGSPKAVVQWLLTLDSFRLSPTVFLVRGLSIDELTSGAKARLTDAEAIFVCGLETNARLDGCASGVFTLLEWLNAEHQPLVGTHRQSISTGKIGEVVQVDQAAEKADLKLPSGVIEQFPIVDLKELHEV